MINSDCKSQSYADLMVFNKMATKPRWPPKMPRKNNSALDLNMPTLCESFMEKAVFSFWDTVRIRPLFFNWRTKSQKLKLLSSWNFHTRWNMWWTRECVHFIADLGSHLRLTAILTKSLHIFAVFVYFFLFCTISRKLKQLFHKNFTQDGVY